MNKIAALVFLSLLQILDFDKDDVLPEKDKGKEFELSRVEDKEIKEFMGFADKKKNLEGTEDFFQLGNAVLENPIVSTRSKEVPEEESLVVCQEAGTYQISFFQRRVVEVVPEIKKQVKRCNGHLNIGNERYFLKSNAENEEKKRKKELAKDHTLEAYDIEIQRDGALGRYFVLSSWRHKEDSGSCNHFSMQDVSTQPSSEKDLWQTDFPEDLFVVEGNPHCRLLYSQIVDGPEVRPVGGKSIFRDIWSRRLYFSCEPTGESPCSLLREKGGVLMKKRCLKENRFGECDLWEKTYDLGKKASYFKEEPILGLTEVFDSSYDKNTELPSVVSTLSIFSDLKKTGLVNEDEIEIFRGEAMKCQCSFIKGVLYDCCKKMDGLAVATYLAACNSEEQSLAQRRHDGQCHHVGSMKERLGTQTSQVFCCFQTKLARILHEQGREQLKISWGQPEDPKCRGFALNELQSIDFTKIDLSDAIEDVVIDKEELLSKVRSTIDNLQSSGQTEAKLNTDRVVQKQEEIKNGS